MNEKRKTKLLSAAGPLAALGLLSAFFLASWVMPTPSARAYGYFAAAGLTVIMTAAVLNLGMGRFSLEKARLSLPPVLMVAAAACWLVLIESGLGKAAVLFAAGMAVGSYQSHLAPSSLRRKDDSGGPLTESGPDLPAVPMGFLESRPGLPQAAFVIDVLSALFLTAFLFGLGNFRDVSLPLTVLAVAAIWGVLAHESFWRFGFDAEDRRLLSFAFLAFGAEVGVSLALLPIHHLTKAAVAVMLLSFGLSLTRQVVDGTVRTASFRRQALALIIVLAALLASAAWN